ncbi:MAG: FtsQ-type POTRA domain-containing protein [Endomicrobiaceae bacterium]|nr:FtsQ-type POTRA domain-containing protein [Endomicrobiaceae bacterium]
MRNFKRKNSIFNKKMSFANRNSDVNYKKIIRLFLVLVLLMLIIVLFSKIKCYLYTCEKFQIQNIEVTGYQNVTQIEIKELIPFKVGDNLFKVDLSDAEDKIKILKPELKDITMLRKWKRILIKLKERQPEVFIMRGDSLIGLDFDNISFGLRGHMFDMKIPILRYTTNEEKLKLLEFVKLLKPYAKDFIQKITEVKFGEVDDIILTIDGKTIIYWGEFNKAKMKDKTKKMLLVFEDAVNKYTNLDYIDLTFLEKDKIIVKPTVNTDNTEVVPEGRI